MSRRCEGIPNNIEEMLGDIKQCCKNVGGCWVLFFNDDLGTSKRCLRTMRRYWSTLRMLGNTKGQQGCWISLKRHQKTLGTIAKMLGDARQC
jgi:hypothetical protein